MIGSLWPFRRLRGDLPPELARRVERWRRLGEVDGRRPPGAGRWVVVDVESSGLDAASDSLIAVGALGVVDGVIDFADSFEVVLRQEVPSPVPNIEVHGIGATEQVEGTAPAEGLTDFLEFVGKDPLVAFHAPFDAMLLRRAIRRHLGVAFRRAWLDLADIAPLVWPKYAGRLSGLDGWLETLSIPVAYRHRAIADCLATAQLFAMVLPQARAIGAETAGDLIALSRANRTARE
jgi:DNA polymerase-3 subunit epsilon